MKIVRSREKISRQELKAVAAEQFGELVKAVVDTKRRVLAVGGELHADEEAALLEDGSRAEDLWGINLYPEKSGQKWIEFDSVINLKPAFGNRSRRVENPTTRRQIVEIVAELVGRT